MTSICSAWLQPPWHLYFPLLRLYLHHLRSKGNGLIKTRCLGCTFKNTLPIVTSYYVLSYFPFSVSWRSIFFTFYLFNAILFWLLSFPGYMKFVSNSISSWLACLGNRCTTCSTFFPFKIKNLWKLLAFVACFFFPLSIFSFYYIFLFKSFENDNASNTLYLSIHHNQI